MANLLSTSVSGSLSSTGRISTTYNTDRYQFNLSRTSGSNWWFTNDSDKLGLHLNGVGDRIYFATDGNIWSSYYNDWLSNIFNSKQNASTAITTSNIGSQSVNYATTAGSAPANGGTSTHTYRGIIEDTRAAQRSPSAYDDYRVSWEFTNQMPHDSNWLTIMTMQGWHDGYAAWQIMGTATTTAYENWYLRSGVNGTWNPARTIIHSGNIGSQSVSYASNADTVDNLHASDFVRAYTTTSDNIDSNWGQSFKTFDPVPSGTPPIASPNLRTINVGESFTRRTQLAFDYATDRAWFRRRDDGGWQTWREFIHSGNISSQSVSYATSAGDSTNLGGYSSARYVRNDIYNSVDAGFQVFRNIGTIDGSWPSSDHTLGLENSDAGTIVINFHRAGYTSNNLWYNGSQFRFDQVVTSTADFRAPIFYDSADTNYYLDPSNTLKSLNIAGNIDLIARSASWAEGIRVRVPSTSTWGGIRFTRDRGNDDGNWAIGFTGIDSTDDLTFWGNTAGNGAMRMRLDHSSNLIAYGSMRAPIFYDSQDTGFYVDPNATSNLAVVNVSTINPTNTYVGNAIYFGGGNNYLNWTDSRIYSNVAIQGAEVYTAGWFRANGHQGLYNPTNNAHFYPNNASYGSWRIDGTRNGWHGLHFDSGSTLMMNGAETGIHREGYGWQFRWYNGSIFVSRGAYGGGTEYTVIDSGTIGSQSVNYANSAGAVAWSNVSSKPATWLNEPNLIQGSEPDTIRTSGFFESYLGSGNPTGTWMNYINVRHSNTNNGHGFQIGMSYYDNNLWFRSYSGNIPPSFQSWSRALGTNTDPYPSNMNQYVRTTDDVTHNSTTSPTFLVNNHSDNTKGYRIHNTSGSSVSAMFTNSSNQLVIAAGAVDQINLNKKVYVNGVALGVNVAPSATAGRIDASNDIVAYSTSDERFKENITPISNALDKVKTLTGVEFDWRKETKDYHGYVGHDVGVIAQQVKAVLPEAVRTNANGYLAVRYEKLIGLLIEANKELAARVEELEKKLN